jgi:multiple sugar transport system permease protein
MRPAAGVLFVLPALVVLAMLIAYPALYMGWLSVTDDAGRFVGANNFTVMAVTRDPAMAVRNTLYHVGALIVLQLVVGTLVGILLNQPFRGRALLRSLTLVPWVVPGIVAAMTWAWMLHTEFGIVNHLLVGAGAVGEPVGWLVDPDTAMPALIAINVWKQFPFVAVMVLAGLQTVPKELYEAARVDGATFWGEVRHVMLPGIRPVLVAIGVLLTIWGLNAITLIYTMTRGGPANRTLILPIQIFRHGFDSFQLNEAAALSAMFFACTLVLVVIYMRVAGAREEGRL